MCLMWVIEGGTPATLRNILWTWGFFDISLGCAAWVVVKERTVSTLGINESGSGWGFVSGHSAVDAIVWYQVIHDKSLNECPAKYR